MGRFSGVLKVFVDPCSGKQSNVFCNYFFLIEYLSVVEKHILVFLLLGSVLLKISQC